MPPELRSGLEIVKSSPGTFLLVDGASGECFELGARERCVLDLLDGRRTADAVERDFASLYGGALPAGEVAGLLEQLRVLGFLANGSAAQAARRPDPPSADAAPGPVPDPLSAADPKRNVNLVFDLLSAVAGWLIHPYCAWVAGALFLLGVTAVVSGFGQYLRELSGVFQPPRLPLLVIASVLQTVLFLNLPRELIVATAFRKFGGRLDRFGIRFYKHLLPYFQADVGDSFFMLPENRRWTVLWTGIFCSAAIGSVAMIGWWMAEPGTW
ncbi:MAG TPA: hypothetical protein VFQ07_05425, partial [Candidatus Polarisedimenticolia bacterium]|nr:hypothetical protein [Candidatus Polarisedimenticolia bacterium]